MIKNFGQYLIPQIFENDSLKFNKSNINLNTMNVDNILKDFYNIIFNIIDYKYNKDTFIDIIEFINHHEDKYELQMYHQEQFKLDGKLVHGIFYITWDKDGSFETISFSGADAHSNVIDKTWRKK